VKIGFESLPRRPDPAGDARAGLLHPELIGDKEVDEVVLVNLAVILFLVDARDVAPPLLLGRARLRHVEAVAIRQIDHLAARAGDDALALVGIAFRRDRLRRRRPDDRKYNRPYDGLKACHGGLLSWLNFRPSA